MMKNLALTTATAALLGGFFVLAVPAQANGLKTLDAAQNAILVKATPTEIDPLDFPWGLEAGRTETVHIKLKKAVIVLPWLEVERDGDDAVTVKMPPSISVTRGPDGKDLPTAAVIESKNWVMDFTRANKGDDVTFDMQADALNASFESLDDNEQVKASGFNIDAQMTSEGLSVNADFKKFKALIAAMEADLPFGDEVVEVLDFAVKYNADALRVDMMVPSTRSPGKQAVVKTGAELTSGALIMREGRLSIGTESKSGTVAVTEPIPTEVAYGEIGFALSMPTKPSDKSQEMTMSTRIKNVEVDESLWAMVDPKGALEHTVNALVFDMAMIGIFPVSPMDSQARDEAKQSGVETIIPESIKLNALELDGLGLKVEGKGAVEVDGKIPSDVSLNFSVNGLSEFMIAAQEAGFLKPPQAIMVEGMANQLGKEEADGSLTFDVEVKENMLVVNGAPVAPLPGAQ